MKMLFPLFIVVLILGQTLSAEEGVLIKQKTVGLVAKDKLTLRTSPPAGLFYASGEKIGTVEKGAKVVATDQKRVKTLFGEYTWLMVDVVDPKTEKGITKGWVYAGKAGGEFYFETVELKEELKDMQKEEK